MQQLRREQVQHAYNGARLPFALQGCEVVRAVEAAAAVVAQAIAAVAVGEARGEIGKQRNGSVFRCEGAAKLRWRVWR
jgi:hypothetical protein